MSRYDNELREIKERSAYELASDADCFSPDSLESPGAKFLTSVRDGVIESVEYVLNDEEDISLSDAAEKVRDGDYVFDIADGAPDAYAHTRWAEFIDLGAYNEDVSEFGPHGNLTDAAHDALRAIAVRLAFALLDEIAEIE